MDHLELLGYLFAVVVVVYLILKYSSKQRE